MTTLTFDLVILGAGLHSIFAAKNFTEAHPAATVCIIDPWGIKGGMTVGGLTAADFVARASYHTSGRTKAFFCAISASYGSSPTSMENLFEAHVAAAILDDVIDDDPNITFVLDEYVVSAEMAAVTGTSDRKIVSVTTSTGTIYAATYFGDGTYEGDLLALAGCSCTYGREAQSNYNELYAGINTAEQSYSSTGAFADSNGDMFPQFSYRDGLPQGAPDTRLQAMNFREQLTDDGARIVAIAKPEGYDENHQIFVDKTGAASTVVTSFLTITPIVTNKFETNQNDIAGPIAWEWVTASHPRRLELLIQLKLWWYGEWYYRANDSNIPSLTRATYNAYGWSSDEYPEGVPLAYVREGRRLVGEYVVTTQDVDANADFDDAIGKLGYFRDSHAVLRRPGASGFGVETEGHLGYDSAAYCSIPLGAIRPFRGQANNLLVFWAISVTRPTFCSYRMEPTASEIGEVGGLIFAEAFARSLPTADITKPMIQSRLTAIGAITHWEP